MLLEKMGKLVSINWCSWKWNV